MQIIKEKDEFIQERILNYIQFASLEKIRMSIIESNHDVYETLITQILAFTSSADIPTEAKALILKLKKSEITRL